MKKEFIFILTGVLISTAVFAGEGHDHGDSAFAGAVVASAFDLTIEQMANLSIKSEPVEKRVFYETLLVPIVLKSSFESGQISAMGFALPNNKLFQVKKGQGVMIKLDADAKQTFNGKVVRVEALDPKTRLHPIWIDLESKVPALFNLSQGTAEVMISPMEKELGVPKSAVLGEFGTFFVFVKKGNHFEKRAVVLGHETKGYVEIVTGVLDGEEVVTLGNYQLQFVTAQPHTDHADEGGETEDSHVHVDEDAHALETKEEHAAHDHSAHKDEKNHASKEHNHDDHKDEKGHGGKGCTASEKNHVHDHKGE